MDRVGRVPRPTFDAMGASLMRGIVDYGTTLAHLERWNACAASGLRGVVHEDRDLDPIADVELG